jgi:type I restriction enzyme M protein
MFYSTDISVTLWILNQNKKGGAYHERKLRDRSGEILFMDLRTWNETIYEKKYVKFTPEQIAAATKIYHDWQQKKIGAKPELYYSAKMAEIAEKNYSLVPSRYIEFVDRDTELDYDTALKTIGAESAALVERQVENGLKLVKALKKLGY